MLHVLYLRAQPALLHLDPASIVVGYCVIRAVSHTALLVLERLVDVVRLRKQVSLDLRIL